MKKLTLLTLALLFSTQTFANCSIRIYIDPLFSAKVVKSYKKELKRKGHEILTMRDEIFEKYRLVLTYSKAADGESSAVKLIIQEFVAPNYVELSRFEQRAEQNDRNAMALELKKEIPSCPQ